MTCTTPTNDVAPYITGAAPFNTSTRSVSVKFKVAMAGLNAPPQGTPSTTSKNASNSCNPQKDGTALDGPESPPGGASTPGTKLKTVAIFVAPRAAISLPETTEMSAGIWSAGSAIRVAVTTRTSRASAIEGLGIKKSGAQRQLAIAVVF